MYHMNTKLALVDHNKFLSGFKMNMKTVNRNLYKTICAYNQNQKNKIIFQDTVYSCLSATFLLYINNTYNYYIIDTVYT